MAWFALLLGLSGAAACATGGAGEDLRTLPPDDSVFREQSPFPKPERPPAPACPADVPCWSSRREPTPQQAAQLQQARTQAAAARSHSDALRAAEARACLGLHADDRDLGPFSHVQDIAQVSPLTELVGSGQSIGQRTAGVIVLFKNVAGLNAERLQRLLDCQRARGAELAASASAVRQDAQDHQDPLFVRTVEAKVNPTAEGLAVTIRSDDRRAVEEILRRTERLSAP